MVTFRVRNISILIQMCIRDSIQTDDPGRYSSLKYAGTAMIPAGRQTVLKDRIYVRDGVKQVKVSYSAGYKDDTHEQTLEIP